MTAYYISDKLGKCVICDRRVKTEDIYITTSDGYAHRNCVNSLTVIKT